MVPDYRVIRRADCVYCKIYKSDRWDMSKVFNFYESDPGMVRTRADMQSCYFSGTMNCKHLSLVKLPQHNVIVDELHLLLRVTDRLTENLIEECLELDVLKKMGNLAKCLANPESHLNRLIASVRSGGVSFKIWVTQLSSGRGSGHFDCSSLVGEEKKKLLKSLPDTLLVNRVLTLFIPATWQVNIPMLPEHFGKSRCYKK